MIDLKNRKIAEDGTVVFLKDQIFEYLYQGGNLDGLVCDGPSDQITKYNQLIEAHNRNDFSPIIIHNGETKSLDITEWFIPDDIKSINVKEYCLSKCSDQLEIDRIIEEMAIYEKYELENLLRLMIYLVQIMRQNNIVWGVGRGSSTASYVLYLIGIHKINSLKYDLDFSEFIKTGVIS